MRKHFGILALAIFVVPVNAFSGDEIPDRTAYAWNFPISIDQAAEFVAADLSLQVYQSVSDPNLRDLGVYNADGQAVPRIIRQSEENPENVETLVPLGMVPLHGELEKSQERLQFLMENSPSGTRLQFDSVAREAETNPEELNAYIVDLRSLEENESFTWLEFQWADTDSGFIGNVFIHTSDDLSGWQNLAQGTLAELEFEGTRIEQDRIDVNPRMGDFLRITWRDMPDDWSLNSLRGVRVERGPDEARDWLGLTPVSQSEDGREFIFDIGGVPPVDRANLVLSGKNVVVRASLDQRPGPDAPWRNVHEGLFYHISRAGNSIASSPARLGIHRAGQWRVRILSGRVDGEPQLRLGWRPDHLVFLNQGQPPFVLASGRAQDSIGQYPQHRLLGDRSLFTMLLDAGDPGVARLGNRSQAAGTAVMTSKHEWTWRTALVWFGLVGAVLFVGWLVWSLVRENRKNT